MANDFELACRLFPIKSQAEIDEAVARLRRFIAKPPARTPKDLVERARAWLGYTLVTAAIDLWDFRTLGVRSAKDRDKPGDVAAMLHAGWKAAKQALDRLPPKSPWLYDVRWALAFAYLYWEPPAGPRQAEQRAMKHRHAKVLYHEAVAASVTADDPDLALYAEIADGLAYLGEVRTAQRLINKAIRLADAKGRTPDWFWWVKGWVHFNAAALEEDEGRSDAHYAKAVRAIRRMFRMDRDNPDQEVLPEHFDALVILAVSSLEIGERVDAERYAHAAREIVRDQKKVDWSFAKEMARHPFDPYDEDAQTLERHLRRSIKGLLP